MTVKKIITNFKSIFSIALLCLTQGAGAASPYTFYQLAGVISQPLDINSSGVVVGRSYVNDSSTVHAISWVAGSAIDIGVANPDHSSANGVNDLGLIVGISYGLGNRNHATIWSGMVVNDLHPVEYRESFALDVNNSGQVVGHLKPTADFYAVDTHKAFLWEGNQLIHLDSLGGTGSSADRINQKGQIVGWSFTSGNSEIHATRWDDKTAIDLGTLGGYQSQATDINEFNQTVGWSFVGGGGSVHATLWNGELATDLGTLGGSSSYAYAINNNGIAVGTSKDSSNRERAVLWSGTNIIDINNLLSAGDVNAGWVLTSAYAINDSGSIVGEGYNRLTNKRSGFMLMAAIPEPATYALMFSGLCFVGSVAQRRKIVRAEKA
jgi:probable HAF family extracellular repeat protein